MSRTDVNSALRELEKENELLLSQLHLAQEELESYYLTNENSEKITDKKLNFSGNTARSNNFWIHDDLPAVLADNIRLKKLCKLQQEIRELEMRNSMPARLAFTLKELAGTSIKLFRAPQRLLSFWSKESKKTAPLKLGGQGHSKVLSTYKDKGMLAVTRLLEDDALSATQRANAWTDLARNLQESNCQASAEAARHAYEIDPKAFRLKWLAFRLSKAGDYQLADAALDLLPRDLILNTSEQQSADKIRNKAGRERLQEAKANSRFDVLREEVEKQLQKLISERNVLHIKVQKLESELETQRSKLFDEVEMNKQELAQFVETKIERESLQKQHSELLSKYEQLIKQAEQDKKELAQCNEQMNSIRSNLESLLVTERQLIECKSELEKLKELTKRLENTVVTLTEKNQENMITVEKKDVKISELERALGEEKEKERVGMLQQQVMSEEMARAEAQLEIVKELLLNDAES